jgi:hypothetical protein
VRGHPWLHVFPLLFSLSVPLCLSVSLSLSSALSLCPPSLTPSSAPYDWPASLFLGPRRTVPRWETHLRFVVVQEQSERLGTQCKQGLRLRDSPPLSDPHSSLDSYVVRIKWDKSLASAGHQGGRDGHALVGLPDWPT